MWTRVAGHLVVPRLGTFPTDVCPAGRLLPFAALGAHACELLTEPPAGGHEACTSVSVACGGQVEPLGLYCDNFLSCRMAGQGGRRFALNPDHVLGWDDASLDAVLSTVEVPFLATLPREQWHQPLGIRELRIAFNLDRLRASIQRLRTMSFDEIASRRDLCMYVHRRPFALPEHRAHFHRKLAALESRLAGYRSAQAFEDDLRTLTI